jgi:hypothetical protein
MMCVLWNPLFEMRLLRATRGYKELESYKK